MTEMTENGKTAEGAEHPRRVAFWGWGWHYLSVITLITRFMAEGQFEAVAVTGNRLPPCTTLDGIPVMSPGELREAGVDYIFIMHDVKEAEIMEEAMAEGFTRDQLLPYKLFHLPYFDFRKYARIKERKISIITNDCWGAFFSNALGLMNRSPFRTLYLLDWDYLKCLRDLPHYVRDTEPVFSRMQKGNENDVFAEYPVIRLDDVEMFCNHDPDPETAIANWNRRRALMNWDDLFVEMRTKLPESEEAFEALEQYPRRICFVPYETTKPHSYRIVPTTPNRSFGDAVQDAVRVSSSNIQFDMLELLDTGRIRERAGGYTV